MMTFVIALLAMTTSISSNAQTYFSESFEGTFFLNGVSPTAATAAGPNAPSTWTQTRVVNNVAPPTACSTSGGKDWGQMSWSGTAYTNVLNTGLGTSGCSPFGGAPTAPPDGTKVMWFYDGWCSTGNTRRIESPAINLTSSTAPVLTFSYSYAQSSTTLTVVGSLDGGTTWNTLSALALTGTGVWVTKVVAIPAAYKVANAKFGYQIVSTFGSFDAFIDNVIVKEGVAANAAPTTLTFTTVTPTATTLNWVDASTNETSFNIYRSTDNVNFTLIGNVASTTTAGTGTAYTSVQSGLTPGVTYFYRVAAFTEVESAYLTGSQATTAATTYYYVGAASGSDLTTAASWNTNPVGGGTTRTTPATTDILIIDGIGTANTAGGITIAMGASTSIGALQITNGTAVTLTSSSATTRTITLTGSVGDELSIPAGTSLIFNSATNAAAIAFSTGTGMTGDISGTLTFGGSTSNVLTTTGGTGTLVTVSSTGIVNLGAAGNTLVGSAATLIIANGANINSSGATTGAPPVPLATWGASSNLVVTGITTSSTAPTNNAQSFGNLIYNCPAASATMSWFTSSTTSVIKGDLTITATGTGIFRALTTGTLNVTGNVIVNGGTFQSASSTGTLIVTGNTSIGASGKIDILAGTYSQRGTTFTNNGVLTGVVSTAVLQFFSPTNIAQTFTGTGTVLTNIGSISVQNAGGLTISTTNTVPTLRVNLFIGTVTGSGKITIGTGAALATFVQIGATGLTTSGGSFDANPIFNLGTGTYTILYQFETTARSTGFEIPPTRLISAATIGNPNNVTVTGGALGIGTLTLQAGKLITTAANLATITGTTTTSTARSTYSSTAASSSGTTVTITSTTSLFVGMNVTVTAGTGAFAANTTVTSIPSTTTFVVSAAPTTALSGATVAGVGGWVSGPLAITLPASLVTGSTYTIPVGKATYNSFELVNPTTGAGGTVVVQSEVFDATSGGTAGTLLGSINTTRYWATSITSGSGNFTNSFIRLNDTRGTSDAIGASATQTGAYNQVGGVVATLTANSITSTAPAVTTLPGFFVMGNLAAATISNLAITPSGNQCLNVARTVTVMVTPGGAAVTGVALNYSINGVAQTAVTMTNTTGNGGLSADTWSGVIPTVTPANANVTWSVTATDANTLTTSATGTPYKDEPLTGAVATASASVNPVCAGASTILSATLIGTGTGNSTSIGTGTSTTALTDELTAFCNRRITYQHQAIFTAAELQAAGLAAGNITAIAYNITAVGDASTTSSYTVKMGTTALSALTTSWVTAGLTTVRNAATYTHAVGLNTITFNTPFSWDGTSNIIIDVTHGGIDAINNATTTYSTPGANRQSFGFNGATTATLSANRLNVVFTGQTQTNIPITSVVWNNGGGTGNPVTVNPTATTTYTGTITALGCTTTTNGLLVNVNALPAAPGQGTFPSFQCGTGVPNAFVTGASAGQFRWYTVPTGGTALTGEQNSALSSYIITATTHFYVAINNGTCEGPRTDVTANVVAADAITAKANGVATSASACLASTVALSVDQVVVNPNVYQYTWTCTSPNVATSGLTSPSAPTTSGNLSVTPTAAGTYTYHVVGYDAGLGCTNTSDVNVTISPLPVIDSIKANPITICTGGSSTLKVYSPAIVSGPQTQPTGYAAASFTSTTEDDIGQVTFGTINNPAVRPTPQTNNATAVNTYTDYTSVPATTITAGQSYPITVYHFHSTTDATANFANVYIDFNRDGDFLDAGELTSLSKPGSTFLEDFVGSISVPLTATAGVTRMRVVVKEGTISAPSGSLGTWGEAEDYLVNVLGVSPQNSSPNITYTWDNGGGTGSTVSVTPGSTTLYTATVLNTTTTCANTATVTVNVNQLPPAPTGTSSDQCGTVTPTASVSSNSGVPTPVFAWYTVPTGGTAIAGQTGSQLVGPYVVGATTTFYVAEVSAAGCESTREPVTVTVSTPDALSATATLQSICPGGSTDLSSSYTPDFNSFATFTLTASPQTGSGITNPTALTPNATGSDPFTVTPTAPGTYIYTITAFDPDKGCTSFDTVIVQVNGLPSVSTFTVTPSPVCEGATLNLAASTIVGAPGTATVNSGTATTEFGGGVYRNGFGTGDFRHQLLFTAAELHAAGITTGNITSVSFNVTSAGSGSANNYTIKLAHTAATAATTTFQTGTFTTCYTAATYTAVNGINLHTFTTPFAWNGTSNLLVDICYTISSIGSSSTVSANTTAVLSNSQLLGTAGACTATTGTTFANRPTATFGAVVGSNQTSSNTWAFNPGAISGGTTGTATTIASAGVNSYTATATNSFGCSTTSAPVSVTVNPTPAAPSVTPSTQCGVGVPTASATGTGAVLRWYSAATGGTLLQRGGNTYTGSISVPTHFYVSDSSAAGCEGPRADVFANVTAPPTLVITPATAATFCLNGSVALNASTGSDPSYVNFTWSAVPPAGAGLSGTSGAAITVTPTVAGTYAINVSANDGIPVTGCTNTATINVTANPNPVISSATATPATVCSGGSSTLQATSIAGGAGFATLGSGADITTLSTDGTPYRVGNSVGNQFKNQYLILASELQAQGLLAGNITSVQLTMAGSGGGTLSNFTIKVGATAQTVMTSTYVTGLTTVLSLATYPTSGTVTTGLQTHTFTTPFNWDGTSNIVLEMCAQLATAGSAGTLAGDDVTYAATILNNPTTTACASATTGGGTSTIRPKLTFGGFVGQDVTASYNWQWAPGLPAGSSVIVNPTTAGPHNYTLTVINPVTSCSASLASPVVVTVQAVTANATATVSAVCIGGSTTISANASGGGPFTYAWSDGTATVYPATATITVSPTATTTYTVTVTDACSQSITSSKQIVVNPLPTVSVNETGATICSPATYGLTANTNAASPAYQWRKDAGDISGQTAGSYTVTGTGNYAVKVTDGVTGCINTSSAVTVTVNPSPAAVSIAPPSAAICLGANVSLTASGGTTGGSGTGTIGTATTLSSATDVNTAFNNRWPSARLQLLYTAAELQTAGLGAGNINSLAFNINSLGDAATNANYRIKIGNTALSALTAFVDTTTGFTNVYNPKTYTHTATGLQTIPFDAPFNWNGTSNIIIQVCMSGADNINNAQTYYTATSTNQAAYTAQSQSDVATLSLNRLNIVLAYNSVSPATWSWMPTTGLNVSNVATVIASPTVTTTYTARATNSFGCFKESTVEVTVNPVTTITVDAAPATQLVGQNTTATPLTVTATGTGTVTYQWFSNATNSSTGGTAVGTGASYAPSTTAVGTLYYYAVASSTCGTATSSVVRVDVVNSNTNFWSAGNGTTNWNTPANWSLNAVPTTLNDIVIPTTPSGGIIYPALSGASVAKNVSIQTGATISLNGNTLTLSGGVSGAGKFIGSSTSSLVIGGTSALSFITGAGSELKNLTINVGTTTLAAALDITAGTGGINSGNFGTVTVAGGATLASGGFLTFKSNASGTARLASGNVTGDVTVERYIPGNPQRAWRMLSIPTTGAQKIHQAWQEGSTVNNFNPKPGFGTVITSNVGPYATLIANGFDESTAKASMQSFNSTTGAWVDITATQGAGSTGNIQTNRGYAIYVRGDRTQTASGAVTSTTPTVLRTTGSLYIGNQSAIAIGANKFDILGNVFVSAIDFTGLTRVGMTNVYYIWDPKLPASGGSLGGYVSFSGTNGFLPVPATGSYTTANTVIESGQAFFVVAGAAGGSVAIPESAKVASSRSTVFRPASAPQKLNAYLYVTDAANNTIMADANVSVFDDAYSNSVDGDDAIKLTNAGENFAIHRSNTNLVVEGRQSITATDTTFFWMWNIRQQQQYRLELVTDQMNVPGLTAFLQDDYLGTTTALDLAAGTTNYSFTVNADVNSSTANRFRVVYRQVQSGPLPVTFVSLNANKVGAAVKVDWKVAAERGIQKYEVERSADGIGFAKVGTVTATGNYNSNDIAYSWMDAAPLSGNNFYRIKSVGTSGEIKYTYIVKVSIGTVKPSFTIAPNPVEGSVVNIMFKNQVQGRYNIRLMAATGEVVFTAIAEHSGGTGNQFINLPSTIARGAYQLEIISPDKTRKVENLFINTLK